MGFQTHGDGIINTWQWDSKHMVMGFQTHGDGIINAWRWNYKRMAMARGTPYIHGGFVRLL